MVNSRYRGFALPSVMIASVVMLMVMVTALSAVATTRVALDEQYYNQLAREAAESGLTVAKRCFVDENTTWSAPLRPGGGCGGTASQGSGANSYVVSSDLIRSTFEVALSDGARDSATLRSTGTVELLRKSTGTAWATYAQSMSQLQQTTNVPGVTWRQISTAPAHACAVASDNKAYCWGYGADGRLGNGDTNNRTQPQVVSRGAMPAGATILQISAHDKHTCAIASNNQIYCWGSAANGRLGNGQTSGTYTTPVAVAVGAREGSQALKVAAGSSHTCAIGSNYRLYCWGMGADGRLGNGSSLDRATPVEVSRGAMPSDRTVRDVSVGSWHACAIAADNQAYCWGHGGYGRLGNGSSGTHNQPVAVARGSMPADRNIRSISVSRNHTCAITAADNKAHCWGYGLYGRLGQGSDHLDKTVPVQVQDGSIPSGASIQQIATGGGHTCAAVSNGSAYCWGYGLNGRLGNGDTDDRDLPTLVLRGSMRPGTTVREITTDANSFVCGITSDDRAYCWGSGGYGHLGNGSTAQRNLPAEVSYVAFEASRPLLNTQVVTGDEHSCGISSDGKAYCWGRNNNGQLGDGTTNNTSTPVAVLQGDMPEGSKVRKLATGTHHTCAIVSDGNVYCWGSGANYRLGRGTNAADSLVPVAVLRGVIPVGDTAIDITAGTGHTCVIASNHLPYCWGLNDFRQIGNGTVDRQSPVVLAQGARPAGSTVLQIKAGRAHTCALVSNYRVYCWGRSQNGEMGNGTSPSTPTATPVLTSFGAMPSSATVWKLEVGQYHNCAIASTSRSYCWGYNGNGQVGDGTNVSKNLPTEVVQGAMPSIYGVGEMGMSGSYRNSCFIHINNRAYCWGDNADGQLGTGGTTSSRTPLLVGLGTMPSSSTIHQVNVGLRHACAIVSNGETYCWGNNAYGQLGDGTTTVSSTPRIVRPLADYPPAAPGRTVVF